MAVDRITLGTEIRRFHRKLQSQSDNLTNFSLERLHPNAQS
ncbi:MAG TPA: hypothetical protein VK137_11695 [Planctomycetaceae bacterium]|nr:hypothetical protein [Planctomycetaceae bacterium]